MKDEETKHITDQSMDTKGWPSTKHKEESKIEKLKQWHGGANATKTSRHKQVSCKAYDRRKQYTAGEKLATTGIARFIKMRRQQGGAQGVGWDSKWALHRPVYKVSFHGGELKGGGGLGFWLRGLKPPAPTPWLCPCKQTITLQQVVRHGTNFWKSFLVLTFYICWHRWRIHGF